MLYLSPDLGPGELAAVSAIDELRERLRFSVAEPRRWVGSVRRVLAARAVQGSNSIEGIHVSVEDAVALVDGEEPADPRSLDALAVAGYRQAMTYVVGLGGDPHFTYSTDLLRGLHFMMTGYTLDASPGRYRPGPIWVRDSASGEAVYTAPEADDIPTLMEELVTDLRSDTADPALVRAAMAHLNLVLIHPFRDGNGRMSRALQTLVLARERILAAELSSIEEYLGRNTARYYAVLAEVGTGRWRPDSDTRPWVRFCLEAHFVQATSVLRRIEESGRIWTSIEQLRSARNLPERCTAALFDAAIGLQIRNAGYRAVLRGWDEPISNQTATTDLRAMVNSGLLHVQGRNRGAYYEASDLLRGVTVAARANRRPIDTTRLFDA